MIICLSGSKRVGKDVTADVLVSKHNFQKISLADPIRELCREVFGITITTFTDDNLKEKPFVRPYILEEHNIDDIAMYVEDNWNMGISDGTLSDMRKLEGKELLHPRHILQFVGTELLRNNIDKNIFLKLADKKIDATTRNVVITDCRFSNEREWFKKQGAVLCLVKRPVVRYIDMHMSENDLGKEEDYDVIMTNDGTLSGFKVDVEEWIATKLARRSY